MAKPSNPRVDGLDKIFRVPSWIRLPDWEIKTPTKKLESKRMIR
jgi:hypothetical protein